MKLKTFFKPSLFQVLILISQLIVAPLLITILSEQHYGIYAYIFTIFAFINFLDLGLSPILIREINNLSENSLEKLSTIKFINEIVAVTVFFIVSIVLFIKEFDVGNQVFTFSFLAACAAGLFLSLKWNQIFYTSCLKGFLKHGSILLCQLITFIVSNFIFINFIDGGLENYIYLMLVFTLIELMYFKFLLKLHINIKKSKFNLKCLENDKNFGLGITLTTLLASIYKQGDKFILSELLPMKFLGYYHVINLIIKGLSVLPSLINSMYFSYLSKKASSEVLKKDFNKQFLIIFVYAFISYGILYTNSGLILRLWLDINLNNELTSFLSILAIAYFINTIVGTYFNLYISQGKSRLSIYNNLVAVFIFLPITYLLIENYGFIGVSYSWLSYNIIYFLVFGFVVSYKIIDISDFFHNFFLLTIGILLIFSMNDLNILAENEIIRFAVFSTFFIIISALFLYIKRIKLYD